MLLTKISMLTKKENSREIDITQDRIDAWRSCQTKRSRQLIRDAFPHLSEDDREFILTGITPEEWDEAMANETPGFEFDN